MALFVTEESEDVMRKILLLLLIAMSTTGCFRSIGHDFTTGAAEGLLTKDSALNAMTSRLAGQVVAAARDSLITPQFSRQITATIDSIFEHVGIGARREVAALRDTLLNRYLVDLVAEIRSAAIGSGARADIDALRAELIGRKAQRDLEALMMTVLGDTTLSRVTALRDELVGSGTSARIDTLISHAITQLASDYRSKLQPLVREEGGWLQKNATTLAWINGGIIAALLLLAGWLFRKYSKYAKMLNVITYQIHDMDNANEYDDLTERISKKSKEVGVEAELRSMLKDRGLLDDSTPQPSVQVA